MIPVLRAKISDHDLFGIVNVSSMKEVMRHESSKWLWIASIIMVRTGSSHKKYEGIRTGIGIVFAVSSWNFENF